MYKKIIFDQINNITPQTPLIKKLVTHILVVEDNDTIRENTIKNLRRLEAEGLIGPIDIREASDGQYALDILFDGLANNWKADVIISDIKMPEISGEELCRIIRSGDDAQLRAIKDIYYIMLSGEVSETGRQERAFQTGADLVLQKGLDAAIFSYQISSAINKATQLKLSKNIINSYLNPDLVAHWVSLGGVDESFYDTNIGIIFGDIVSSSEISQSMTSNELGALINGILSIAKDLVVKNKGFYNKTIGDEFMLHFGGPIDITLTKEENPKKVIAERMIGFAIDFQRAILDFHNYAYQSPDAEAQLLIEKSYAVLRKKSATKEFLRVWVRLGINMGKSTVGNYGPINHNQYDVLGDMINIAARLQTSCPPGGARIHQSVYENLNDNKFIIKYIDEFKKTASAYYKNISNDEIFNFKFVEAKGYSDKEPTYSLQIIPNLPEIISGTIETMLSCGQEYLPKILDTIRLYRGNKYVLKALDDLFKKYNIFVNKAEILGILKNKTPQEIEKLVPDIQNKSFYSLLRIIGEKQDEIHNKSIKNSISNSQTFDNPEYFKEQDKVIIEKTAISQKIAQENNELYNNIIPRVFLRFEKGLREYFSTQLKNN